MLRLLLDRPTIFFDCDAQISAIPPISSERIFDIGPLDRPCTNREKFSVIQFMLDFAERTSHFCFRGGAAGASRGASRETWRLRLMQRLRAFRRRCRRSTLTTTDCSDRNSGNSRCGHDFGTRLNAQEKEALLEYLKTL